MIPVLEINLFCQYLVSSFETFIQLMDMSWIKQVGDSVEIPVALYHRAETNRIRFLNPTKIISEFCSKGASFTEIYLGGNHVLVTVLQRVNLVMSCFCGTLAVHVVDVVRDLLEGSRWHAPVLKSYKGLCLLLSLKGGGESSINCRRKPQSKLLSR